MKNFKIRLYFLLFLQTILAFFQDYHYDYLSYDQIIAQIGEFGSNYPQFIKIYNITENDLPFPNIMPCGDSK